MDKRNIGEIFIKVMIVSAVGLLLLWGVLHLIDSISPLDIRDRVGATLFLVIVGISVIPLTTIAKIDQNDERAWDCIFPLIAIGWIIAVVDLFMLDVLGAPLRPSWGFILCPLLQVPLGLLLLWRRNMINLVYFILLTLPIIGILFGG